MTKRGEDPVPQDDDGEPATASSPTSADHEFIELNRIYAEEQRYDRSTGELRADAARNRKRVVKAAEKLFAKHDARKVTMDDIARAAGVGRATLYRRFTTPSSVALAILDEHERQLQGKILRGVPPLGPGAPSAERLSAFYAAMVDLLERHLHLALGAETGHDRFQTGAYRFWRLHVRMLLTTDWTGGPDEPGTSAKQNPSSKSAQRDALSKSAKQNPSSTSAKQDSAGRLDGRSGVLGDVDTMVDLLLAPLAPELYNYQRHEVGLSQAQITASLDALARRVF